MTHCLHSFCHSGMVCSHIIKVFLPLSTFNTAHVRKIPGSPSPPQLQCSCSGTGEPGNEANSFWLHSVSDQTGCVGWPGNEAVHLDLGMRLYILTWEWGCTSWPGNGAVHLGLGMGLYILTWEWGCTSWPGNGAVHLVVDSGTKWGCDCSEMGLWPTLYAF